MNLSPLHKLQSYGQSLWLDFIRRSMIASGELRRFIEEDGLSGVTSNPAIFDKAIAGTHDYDTEIECLVTEGKSPEEIYELLTVGDIRRAADELRPVYEHTHGRDGFVSLEVSPHLAYETDGTITEAHRLWRELDRPNVLIKVPATDEGLPAIRRLTRDGVNVNVTLLFGLHRYRQVAEAYLLGLEDRVARGGSLERVTSVASFFLSRIDTHVDLILNKTAEHGGLDGEAARSLCGKAAIACAKMAYQTWLGTFGAERFRRLANAGARTQRLLWASTSAKNPAYSDVKYVEPLIGPETITTLPLETLEAYRDHGAPSLSVEEHLAEYAHALDRLPDYGVFLDRVAEGLEIEGVRKFAEPYDHLLGTLEEKSALVVAH